MSSPNTSRAARKQARRRRREAVRGHTASWPTRLHISVRRLPWRARSLRRPRGRRPIWLTPVRPVGRQAAQMMTDAMRIENIDAAELAAAAGREPAWIEAVADGRIDPTLDELELAVNAVGLETRIATLIPHWMPDSFWDDSTAWPTPAHDREALAERIARSRAVDSELYGETDVRRGAPQPGASARLFSAGPGRTDGGGWAAILAGNCLHALRMTSREAAVSAGWDPARCNGMQSGAFKPSCDGMEAFLACNGIRMAVRLDVYDDHDDEHHAMWLADPDGYEAVSRQIGAEVNTAWEAQKTQTTRQSRS